ncbi:type II toxin-antitoxin system HipA family toxin [Nucisporomicrobium flavum]|uniref:type II toxin-antitoxin system HipA family toxin n=1 Tax=Nucisporomicrobium flavum TaxID=2785915 RepID=UPI0018F41CD1|nr:type II toxin-antitoxin system HipA family toxin [Nucisporomicrobium flavum]
MTDHLLVLLAGRHAATLAQGAAGVLTLTYTDEWISLPGTMPISFSMPPSVKVHEGPVVRAFCQGLLPDNERVLERWARDFQVSAANPYALLAHVGEDCAGAVQFVRPERLPALLARKGEVVPLTDDAVAARLRALRGDPAAWHLPGSGQFSLAGAQAKTALYCDARTGSWGDPSGAVPTTHIIKPAIAGLDDHDLNEHLCMVAAQVAGLRTAQSQVLSFDGERAVVVDRYDRWPGPDGTILRVHQEDMCQALGLAPTSKYQSDGGPGPEHIIALLRRVVEPSVVAEGEVDRFVDALAFNWFVAGTDAHAKNYSLLLEGRQVRLAPLYDLASSLPYDDMYLPRLRLAMKIGSEYRVSAIGARHWRAFAERNELDADRVLDRVADLAERLPDAFRESARDEAVAALKSDLPGRLAARVTKHVSDCRRALARR